MKHLTITLLTLLISVGVWTEDTTILDADSCVCNGEYENYCRLNESEHFIGICSGPYKRVFGKTFYDSGTIFDGSYREDNSRHIGLLEFSNGNKIQGEFNISSEDYSLPKEIDGAALLYVAVLFVRNITDIEWDDIAESAPAIVAMIAMPLTYSISNGIALAFIAYALIKILTGKFSSTSPAIWVIAILSVISFAVA